MKHKNYLLCMTIISGIFLSLIIVYKISHREPYLLVYVENNCWKIEQCILDKITDAYNLSIHAQHYGRLIYYLNDHRANPPDKKIFRRSDQECMVVAKTDRHNMAIAFIGVRQNDKLLVTIKRIK